MTDEKTFKLLFDLTYKELEYERKRAFNLETKALRYITLSGVLFSILTTYFLFNPASEFKNIFNESFKWFKLVFLFSYIFFMISWIPLVICMKTYTSRTFDVEKLIDEYENDTIQKALQDITNNELKGYVKEIAKKTKSKSTALLIGFIFIILGACIMIFGILLYFFNL